MRRALARRCCYFNSIGNSWINYLTILGSHNLAGAESGFQDIIW